MESDEVLFGEGYGPSTYVNVREVEGGRYLVYSARHGWATSELYVQEGRGGSVRPVVTGEVEVPPFHSASIRGSGPGFALLTLSSFTSPSIS
jgi:hypothetical protein